MSILNWSNQDWSNAKDIDVAKRMKKIKHDGIIVRIRAEDASDLLVCSLICKGACNESCHISPLRNNLKYLYLYAVNGAAFLPQMNVVMNFTKLMNILEDCNFGKSITVEVLDEKDEWKLSSNI